jgi:putative ABC transport system permease protein
MQFPPRDLILAVKTAQDPRGVKSLVRSAVREIDECAHRRHRGDQALLSDVDGLRLAAGVVVALMGVYSVMAYVVGQRTREIGIRMALGATPRQVRGAVLGSGATLVVAGLALGTGAAPLASRVLQSLLFGVTPRDPVAIAVAVTLLGLLSLIAAYAPARRAAMLDPVAALRRE